MIIDLILTHHAITKQSTVTGSIGQNLISCFFGVLQVTLHETGDYSFRFRLSTDG